MAIGDYDIFTTNATVALDTSVSVIAGGSSLRLAGTAIVQASYANVIATIAGAYDVGALTIGRQRALFRPVSMFPLGLAKCGFTAMQSQRDLQTAGAAYFCCLEEYDNGIISGRVQLYRFSSGLDTVSPTQLAVAPYNLANGVNVALAFQWILNTAELAGIDLTVWVGANFAALTQVIHVVDLHSDGAPLVTVGQGIAFSEASGYAWVHDWRIDTHEVYGPP